MSVTHPALIVVIGGFHSPALTTNLLLTAAADPVLGQVSLLHFPRASLASVLSAHAMRRAIDRCWHEQRGVATPPDLLIWAFSAGCVGAVELASHWHWHRGRVLGLFAVDGWGVPLVADFPVYRLSHDRFTHVTSQWLGAGAIGFWADPPVSHLDFWSQLPQTEGWQMGRGAGGQDRRQRLTAWEFLCRWSCSHLNSVYPPG